MLAARSEDREVGTIIGGIMPDIQSIIGAVFVVIMGIIGSFM